MVMGIGSELLSKKYKTQCSAKCDSSCGAHERGLLWVLDPSTGEDVLIASHDTPKRDGHYGGWYQEFERRG